MEILGGEEAYLLLEQIRPNRCPRLLYQFEFPPLQQMRVPLAPYLHLALSVLLILAICLTSLNFLAILYTLASLEIPSENSQLILYRKHSFFLFLIHLPFLFVFGQSLQIIHETLKLLWFGVLVFRTEPLNTNITLKGRVDLV